jgi:hypothetical protein
MVITPVVGHWFNEPYILSTALAMSLAGSTSPLWRGARRAGWVSQEAKEITRKGISNRRTRNNEWKEELGER